MSNSKKKYYLKTPGKILLAALIVLVIWFVFGAIRRFFGRSETYSNADFGIPDYISKTDTDNDGLDDQSDILAGAREYVAKRPIYESKYYKDGWPTDNCGVCTDVVANALKSAGYNLQELVDEDIKLAPNEYGSDCGDRNIDFRRVRNLLVYFSRHSIPLSCDITEIGEWQGGDIVVFEGHIGIVSDRRNKNGTPLLIHHGGSNGAGNRLRPNYEEDVLDQQSDIVGHFRIS